MQCLNAISLSLRRHDEGRLCVLGALHFQLVYSPVEHEPAQVSKWQIYQKVRLVNQT